MSYMRPKIGIYEFLPQPGGGQKVAALIAEALSETYDVTMLIPKPTPRKWWEEIFGVNFKQVKVDMVGIENQNGQACSVLLSHYDIFINAEYAYWAIDPSNADRKFIMAHDAHPLGNEPDFMAEYESVIACSKYGQQKLQDEKWTIPSKVIYPPIFKCQPFSYENKVNRIMCVARFDKNRGMNSLPLVLEGFRTAVDNGLQGWELVLAGWVQNADVFNKLATRAMDYPIRFCANPHNDQLNRLYASSKFLLNLRGIDSKKPSTAFSHEALGVVTIEAIAAGCLPIVHDFAGHMETVPIPELRISEPEEYPDRLREILEQFSGQKWLDTSNDLYAHAETTFSANAYRVNFERLLKGDSM